MWHRLTERARRVVFFAQEEVGKRRENFVSTEHLLLGLTREGDTVAARLLERMNISLEQVRAAVPPPADNGQSSYRDGQDMQMTPRLKRVIDLAWEDACRLNNNFLGTEHLLLGLLKEREGTAARVLTGLGISWEQTRREVIRVQERTPTARENGLRVLQELENLPAEQQDALRGGDGVPFSSLPSTAQQAVELFTGSIAGNTEIRIDLTSAIISLDSEQVDDATLENRVRVANAALHAAFLTANQGRDNE